MDNLLTLLAVAGCSYIMGVPGADDVMLAYQSTSFHDALYLRRVLGLRPAPEFEDWLNRMGIFDERNALSRGIKAPRLLGAINELTKEDI
jgi:ethanolamine ammonia-lyase large subunit